MPPKGSASTSCNRAEACPFAGPISTLASRQRSSDHQPKQEEQQHSQGSDDQNPTTTERAACDQLPLFQWFHLRQAIVPAVVNDVLSLNIRTIYRVAIILLYVTDASVARQIQPGFGTEVEHPRFVLSWIQLHGQKPSLAHVLQRIWIAEVQNDWRCRAVVIIRIRRLVDVVVWISDPNVPDRRRFRIRCTRERQIPIESRL